jgi:D-beta-D-heptose 7-phosphate kinase / D-beta-D-heptose 1-phosphate adenosyltransferase
MTTSGEALVASLRGGRVGILGDVMLDCYVTGEVARISPEAPVPVLHVAREREVPGGAANVAANISALGGQAGLLGVVGRDAGGERLAALLALMPDVTTHLLALDDRPTILKTRYVAGQQQIVRVDRERVAPLPASAASDLLAGLDTLLGSSGVLVLSDYGKGVLGDELVAGAIAQAKRRQHRVVVDPKRRDFTAYRGADVITPNRKELTEATGLPCATDEEAEAAARRAHEQCGAAILLTRSERGMSLFQPGREPVHMPAEALEVFDVSGAGDTVAAAFSLALSTGADMETSMRVANAAAGVVVGKRGTASVSPAELLAALARRTARPGSGGNIPSAAAGALQTLQAAIRLRQDWAREGLSVGFANGCFDLLHPGHVALLRQGAAACDRLVVAINSDASVSRLKGPTRPVQTAAARAEVLAALKGVDAVIAFEEETPILAIEALQPDLIVKGADYREDQVVGADIVKARGGRVLLVDLVDGQSTSAMVARSREDKPG